MKNVIEHLIAAVAEHPQRIALVEGNEKISFQQLHHEVLQTVHFYQQKGLGIGDQVLVFVPISINLYRHVLALFYLGAIPVFIDQWVNAKRLKACMECLECKAIIAPQKFLWLSFFISKVNAIPIKIIAKSRSDTRSSSPFFNAASTDSALITFTTGTTGIPKAAVRTHGNLLAQFSALSKLLNPALKISLSTLPIVVLINIGFRRTTVLPTPHFKSKKPRTAIHLIKQMQEYHVESIIASPSVYENIIRFSALQNTNILELITGGGSVFPMSAQKIVAQFPLASAQVIFGGTEAEPVSHIGMELLTELTEDFILKNGLPVGKVTQETNLHLIPYTEKPIFSQLVKDWRLAQLPNFSIGEIVVSGSHVVAQYLNNKADRARYKIIIDGAVWHRTGDIAYKNNKNELFYYGRGSHTFFLNGKPFYPMLLEYFIQQKTGISSFAILEKDNRIRAVMCCKDKNKMAAISSLLTTQLSCVIVFHFVSRIPKDKRHHAKVDYEALIRLIK